MAAGVRQVWREVTSPRPVNKFPNPQLFYNSLPRCLDRSHPVIHTYDTLPYQPPILPDSQGKNV